MDQQSEETLAALAGRTMPEIAREFIETWNILQGSLTIYAYADKDKYVKEMFKLVVQVRYGV